MANQIVIASSSKFGFTLNYTCDECLSEITQQYHFFNFVNRVQKNISPTVLCPHCKNLKEINFNAVQCYRPYYSFTLFIFAWKIHKTRKKQKRNINLCVAWIVSAYIYLTAPPRMSLLLPFASVTFAPAIRLFCPRRALSLLISIRPWRLAVFIWTRSPPLTPLPSLIRRLPALPLASYLRRVTFVSPCPFRFRWTK